jgi:hypothetical protein
MPVLSVTSHGNMSVRCTDTKKLQSRCPLQTPFGQINSKIDEDLKEFSDEEKEKKQKGHHLYQLGQK